MKAMLLLAAVCAACTGVCCKDPATGAKCGKK